MSALFIASSPISPKVSIETTDRCIWRQWLLEPLTAIGVWATRPQPFCVAAKEGELPSLLYLPREASMTFSLPHAQRFELLSRLLTPAALRGGTRRARVQNTPDLHVDIF